MISDRGTGSLGAQTCPMEESARVRHGVAVGLPITSLLDSGAIPVEGLALFTTREASRPRSAYLAHRWFARRFGSAMRALLVGAMTPSDGHFWDEFYGRGEASLSGIRLLDPFVGGGTIVYEAQRLGATVTGVDVDPVACAITSFELRAGACPNPQLGLEEVQRTVGKGMAEFYRTEMNGEERVGLHYFWVQQVHCGVCDVAFDAHPSHLLGVAGKEAWVVCPACGQVHLQDGSADMVSCDCGAAATVESAAADRGNATCPACGHTERLIDIARRSVAPPEWRMFAVESIPVTDRRRVPMAERHFHRATDADLDLYRRAGDELEALRPSLPKRLIPQTGRSDDRLVAYGYRRYTDLFNARQLLHLARLGGAIRAVDAELREPLGLAFSNHLTSNCMLTSYTARWRQVTPLFVVRSYRHSVRPVEINPWLAGIGRGTFPNAVRKVAAAIDYTHSPVEYTATGFEPVARVPAGPALVINGDSRRLTGIPDGSIDLVVTDPPYLDNIAYSELADFFVPWLADVGVLPRRRSDALRATLAAKRRTEEAAGAFGCGLTECFTEVRRVLRPGGRLIFTFQHQSPRPWLEVANSLNTAGFSAVTVLPLKGDGDKGLHHHAASSTWDAVLVLRSGSPQSTPPAISGSTHCQALDEHVENWARCASLADPDREVLRRATYVAGALGFLARADDMSLPLAEVL